MRLAVAIFSLVQVVGCSDPWELRSRPFLDLPTGSVELADVAGDAALDLVVVNGDGIHIAIGDGTGRFATPITTAVAGHGNVALGDATGDGVLDYLVGPDGDYVSGGSADGVQLFDGARDGSAAWIASFPTSEFTLGLGLADVTGDGLDDVVISRSGGDEPGMLAIHVAVAGSDFAAVVELPHARGDNWGMAVADFDGDDADDIAQFAQDSRDAFAHVTLFSPPGTPVSVEVPIPLPTNGTAATPMAVGDVDEDGTDDLVVAGFLARGDGAGGFAAAEDLGFTPTGDLMIGDVDGDGHRDLVHVMNTQIQVRPGHGDGTFDGPHRVGTGDSLYAIGDVNGDGRDDIFYGSTIIGVLLTDG